MHRIASAVRKARQRGHDAGMIPAEYALATVAGCGAVGILYEVVTSTPVKNAIGDVIAKAIHWIF